MDLHDRTVVVTGGASGLGRATVRAAVAGGARVAILDRNGAAAKAVADEVAGSALAVEVDVADPESVAAAMAAVDEAFGSVHVCVNAAGVPTGGKVVAEGKALPLEQFRSVIEVNLIGLFDVMRHCAERMVANEPDAAGERGVIVNVSSGAAWQGQRGQAAYAASKAAVIGLTLPAARDLAEVGIRVVAIAPGLFETGMVGGVPEKLKDRLVGMILNPKRMGDPAEFAALVRHIVENPYLNATTISIDAGARMV